MVFRMCIGMGVQLRIGLELLPWYFELVGASPGVRQWSPLSNCMTDSDDETRSIVSHWEGLQSLQACLERT